MAQDYTRGEDGGDRDGGDRDGGDNKCARQLGQKTADCVT